MSKPRKTRLRRLGLLVAGVCLTLMLLVTLCAAPALAADSGSASGSLPSDIAPVVFMSGSNYDMGYQFAQQMIAYYSTWYYQRVPNVYEPFTDQQIMALKAYQWYIEQNAPEWVDYLKGIAAGATANGFPMSYAEALARATGTKAYPGSEPAGSGDETLPPGACSVWAAWGATTRDGKLLAAKSYDGDPEYFVTTAVYPRDGNNYVNVPGGSRQCMNNKGVFMAGSGLYTQRKIDKASSYYLPYTIGIEHLIRYSDTATAALNTFMNWKQGNSLNRMFADVHGNAYVVEYSPAFKAVRKPGDFGEGNFIYSRNTGFTNEARDAILGVKFWPHGGWTMQPSPGIEDPGGYPDITMASAQTNMTMYNMLSQYQGKVDLNFAKMLYRFTGMLPRDPFSTAEFRATNARAWETPMNLENAMVSICQPDDGDQGSMYVCTGPAGKVNTPYEPGPDDDYYQDGQTYTFYQVPLAGSPADDVAQAKLTAKFDQGYAYQKLMWLDYGDDAYVPLRALFDTAVREYNEGANWTSRAVQASGNDQLLYYARAATAYTRSQCHAQQVYEAIVKPPTTPSALGLKRYIPIVYSPVTP